MIYAFCIVSLIIWPCSLALNDTERTQILSDHNGFRSIVSPSASNMLQMSYNTTLESLAQKWVNYCVWKHPGTSDVEYSGYGQNLGMTTASSLNLQTIVDMWDKEKADYTYSTNTCSKTCGHYTQVVWAKSLQIGCAYQTCTNFSIGSKTYPKAFFIACQYSPPGNYIGQKPYENGTPCSHCPSGYESCVNNLCAPQSSNVNPTNAPVVSTSSGPAITSSDQTTTSSDQTTTSSDQTTTSSDQTTVSSDQTTTSSYQTMTYSDQTTTSSDQTMTYSDQTTTSSSSYII
ncbi:unnamed protein product, partial [Hymenolepis diminuta]